MSSAGAEPPALPSHLVVERLLGRGGMPDHPLFAGGPDLAGLRDDPESRTFLVQQRERRERCVRILSE